LRDQESQDLAARTAGLVSFDKHRTGKAHRCWDSRKLVALEVEIPQSRETGKPRCDATVPKGVVAQCKTPDALIVLANLGAEHFDLLISNPVNPLTTEIERLTAILTVLEGTVDEPDRRGFTARNRHTWLRG
jgi:hypothetical protein